MLHSQSLGRASQRRPSSANSSARRSGRSRVGFTLAELLIVIAIIAVLISILLPSLSAARRAANASKCLASLRDLGLAFQQYAQDNKRAFPVVEWSPPTAGTGSVTITDNIPRRTWQYFLFKYIHKKNVDQNDPVYKDLSSVQGKSTLWGCPEFNGDNFWKAGVLPGAVSFDYTIPNQFNTGYGMNRYGMAPMLPAGTPPGNNPNNYPLIANGAAAGPAGNVSIVRDPVLFGVFTKMELWSKHGAEKCLLADSNCFDLITSNLCPISATIGTGANQIKGPPFISAPTGTIYIMADWTRHIAPSSSIKKAGAARGINVLFADGHAGSLDPVGLWVACRGAGTDVRGP